MFALNLSDLNMLFANHINTGEAVIKLENDSEALRILDPVDVFALNLSDLNMLFANQINVGAGNTLFEEAVLFRRAVDRALKLKSELLDIVDRINAADKEKEDREKAAQAAAAADAVTETEAVAATETAASEVLPEDPASVANPEGTTTESTQTSPAAEVDPVALYLQDPPAQVEGEESDVDID